MVFQDVAFLISRATFSTIEKKFVVEVEVSRPKNFLELWLGASKGMLPVKYIGASKGMLPVKYVGGKQGHTPCKICWGNQGHAPC